MVYKAQKNQLLTELKKINFKVLTIQNQLYISARQKKKNLFALTIPFKGLLVSGGESILILLKKQYQNFHYFTIQSVDKLEGHSGNILCLKNLKDVVDGEFLTLIASGGADKKIILWNLDRAQKIYVLIGHQDQVTCLTFDSTNNQLWSGGADQTIRCWDIDKGKQIFIFKRHTDQISSIEYIASRQLIISGSWDKKIRVSSKSILIN